MKNSQNNKENLIDKKKDYFTLSEESIKERIYVIRGEKVMLDFELAEIYGYSTKAFNQQVKNNKEKFEGFIFQLNDNELEKSSWSKNLTLNKSGNRRGYNFKYYPYAFTETGIYMLMTVLRGPLAIEQSRRLVTIFKQMKDYIQSNNNLLTVNEVLRLTNQVNQNREDIKNIKNELSVVMDNFIDTNRHKAFLILNGKKFEADVAYHSIYDEAKISIDIIDDYIGIKTLELLKEVSKNIRIDIYSDNVNKLSEKIINDFIDETGIKISVHKTNHLFHDRFILIDKEHLYASGPSSKDAGNSIGTIIEIKDKNIIKTISESIAHLDN